MTRTAKTKYFSHSKSQEILITESLHTIDKNMERYIVSSSLPEILSTNLLQWQGQAWNFTEAMKEACNSNFTKSEKITKLQRFYIKQHFQFRMVNLRKSAAIMPVNTRYFLAESCFVKQTPAVNIFSSELATHVNMPNHWIRILTPAL